MFVMDSAVDHIPHIEDHPAGLETLLAAMSEDPRFTVKFDGAPSIFFGYDEEQDEPFVATKSLLNKRHETRKICYSYDDIDQYFGNKPNLAAALKNCLTAIENPKWAIVNARGCVFQGDLLWGSKQDILYSDADHFPYTIKPNVIEYGVSSFAASYDVSIAVHSVYARDPVFGGPYVRTQATHKDIATLLFSFPTVYFPNIFGAFAGQPVWETKEELLDSLGQLAWDMHIDPHGYGDFCHEGYVWHSEKYGLVKIVDREWFRELNSHSRYAGK